MLNRLFAEIMCEDAYLMSDFRRIFSFYYWLLILGVLAIRTFWVLVIFR